MRFEVIVEEFNRLGNHVHSLASPHESENKGIKYWCNKLCYLRWVITDICSNKAYTDFFSRDAIEQ